VASAPAEGSISRAEPPAATLRGALHLRRQLQPLQLAAPAPAAAPGSTGITRARLFVLRMFIVSELQTPLFLQVLAHAVRSRHELYTGSSGLENMGYL